MPKESGYSMPQSNGAHPQRLRHYFTFLCAYAALLVPVFWRNVKTPYASQDDFHFWPDSPAVDGEYPIYYMLFLIGRPFAALLFSWGTHFIHAIQDLSWLRLASVGLDILIAVGITLWMTSRLRVDIFSAFATGAAFALLPGLQTAVIWANNIVIFIGVALAVLAGTLLPGRESPGSEHGQVLRGIFCVVLLTLSVFFYQTAAMPFLLFPLLRILYSDGENRNWVFRQTIRDLALFTLACASYFGITKWIVLPSFHSHNSPAAIKYWSMFGPHRFALAAPHMIPDKIGMLLNQLTPRALDPLLVDYNYNPIISLVFFLVILSGSITACITNIRKRAREKNWKTRALFTGLVMLLLLTSNAPNLLSRNSILESRSTIAYTGMLMALAIWSVSVICRRLAPSLQVGVARLIIGAFVISLALTAEFNLTRCANIFATELGYLESKIIPQAEPGLKLHIITPKQIGNEMTNFTTRARDEDGIPRVIHAVLSSHGLQHLFNSADITHGTIYDPYEKKTKLLVIDMNIPAQPFYPQPVEKPLSGDWVLLRNSRGEVTIDTEQAAAFFGKPGPNKPVVAKREMRLPGIDVITIRSSLFGYRTFGISTGEFDIEKISCPPGGCTKVYSGPNKESILQQARLGEKFATLDNSPGINNNSFITYLDFMKSYFPFWHSGTGAPYPHWIRMEFPHPRLFRRLAISSPPSDAENPINHFKAPKDFVLQGSHDGVYWHDLLDVLNALYSSSLQKLEWKFENSTAYKFYRLFITANNGDRLHVSIFEMQLKEE